MDSDESWILFNVLNYGLWASSVNVVSDANEENILLLRNISNKKSRILYKLQLLLNKY